MTDRNLLMVIDAFSIGGTETHTLSLVKELKKFYMKVTVIGRNGPMVNKFKNLGCKIYIVPFPTTTKISESTKTTIKSQLKSIMVSEKINLVHAHQTPSGILSLEIAKELKVPTIFTAHGTYYPKTDLLRILELSDTIICVSLPLKNYLQKITEREIIVIPNGINTEEFSPSHKSNVKQSLNIPQDNYVIVYASRLSWAKGKRCITFLEACRKLKEKNKNINFHVIVVGTGTLNQKISELTTNIEEGCRSKFIHLAGESSDIKNYYSISDCVVGTGRVALEAMSCGKPVIAVGNHGYFGIVEKSNFETAWNCYFGDHGSLSVPSIDTLSQDIEKLLTSKNREIIGSDSRAWILQQYNVSALGLKLWEAYQNHL